MKIILVVSSMHSGGAERVATTLANAWAARGDEVMIAATFSARGTCFYTVSEKARTVFLADLVNTKKRSLINRLQRLVALRRLFVKERPDVVISFLSDVNVGSVISAAWLGIPVIVCERTDPFIALRPRYLQWAMRLAYPHADMLVVQTEAVAKKVVSTFPRVKRLRVLANPLPEEARQYQRSARHSQRRSLIAMGRLSGEKQFDRLIEVFSSIASRWKEWDLIIYGEGPLRDCLERQVESLGLEKRVVLAGVTKTSWEAMVQSDVFVMTSSLEGFPNALLEAMGLGLPCVVFDCPSGPREMTREGQDAILVPLNDLKALQQALERVMSDEDLRRSLGIRARASVIEKYSLSRILEQWDQLFSEVGARA